MMFFSLAFIVKYTCLTNVHGTQVKREFTSSKSSLRNLVRCFVINSLPLVVSAFTQMLTQISNNNFEALVCRVNALLGIWCTLECVIVELKRLPYKRLNHCGPSRTLLSGFCDREIDLVGVDSSVLWLSGWGWGWAWWGVCCFVRWGLQCMGGYQCYFSQAEVSIHVRINIWIEPRNISIFVCTTWSIL